ncbi:MAG: FeoB-associated Cys-rich membrane protein [Clostridia bacterium]|nr:FeoB-associated Cys-rich membrane protein [Clostridia bacterium]
MKNLLVIGIIAILFGNAIWYLVRKRKQGTKCIGCPYASECNRNCNEHE